MVFLLFGKIYKIRKIFFLFLCLYVFINMKMTKKQLEELVDKTGALIGSKSMSPKYGGAFVGSYDTTDDHVEKTTQDRSYETPYRRYFGEDDLSNHPLFKISKKAKSYSQFIEMVKKHKPKMDNEEVEDAATLFGFRKDKKRIVKEKLTEESSPISLIPGNVYNYKGYLTMGPNKDQQITGKLKFNKQITNDMFEFIIISMDSDKSGHVQSKKPGDRFLTSKDSLKYITPEGVNESILRFSDGVTIDTSGKLRTLELADGWYVVGEGKLIPVKDKEEAKSLIKMMTEKPIEESAKSLLEKIVKIKTKNDVLPKMVKSNNHIDKAISHLKSSMGEIEKYKDMSKVSNIYKSLEKTIKSLESIVDKIEDKKDLMDSINEDTNPELKTKDKDYKVIFDANEQVYKVYYKGSLLVKKHNKKDILSYLD